MYPQSHPYTNPQAPQPSQQYQTVHLSQRPFHPAPPPQAPSSHFSYSNSVVQQRPQHPYPQPYKLPSHTDGPRQYHTDDVWRMQSNDFSTNNPHGPWINGVRSSLVPVPSFAHEGMLGFFSVKFYLSRKYWLYLSLLYCLQYCCALNFINLMANYQCMVSRFLSNYVLNFLLFYFYNGSSWTYFYHELINIL